MAHNGNGIGMKLMFGGQGTVTPPAQQPEREPSPPDTKKELTDGE
jgi:hypothetical protein